MRAIVRPASGWREVKPYLSLRVRAPAAAAQAGRPVDRPRAEPRHGVAQAVVVDRRGGGARGGFRPRRTGRRGRRFSLSGGRGPCRKAILSTHRQPRCAFTRATITEALCCASSAKALSTLSTRVARSDRRVGIAFGGPRRPLQLDRPGVTRERFADDGRPVGDQARLAQAARGQRLGDQPGGEFGQRLGAAARALHHRFGTESEDSGA